MKDRNNVHVFGGDDSGVYIAPLGSQAPAALEAPTAPWKDSGWLGEDGIGLEQKIKKELLRGHQGGAVVRTTFSEFERTFTVTMLESNAVTFGLINPGSKLTVTDGIARATLSDSPKVKPVAAIFDEFEIEPRADGTFAQVRYICPRGIFDPSIKAEYKYGEVTAYEFEYTPEGPVDIVTNLPGYLAAAG